MAIYATHRTSQPPDDRTYSPEVTSSRSNLPVHRSAAGRVFPFHASLIIIKDFPRNVNRNFYVFYEILKIFLGAPPGRGDCPVRDGEWAGPALVFRADAARERGTVPALPAGMHPPFSFWGAKKRTGRARSKRKNARGGPAHRVPGKSLPAAWCGRGFGSSGHPPLLFPLALQGSVSGARRTGFPITSNVDCRSGHAGNADSRDENSARRQETSALMAVR